MRIYKVKVGTASGDVRDVGIIRAKNYAALTEKALRFADKWEFNVEVEVVSVELLGQEES